MKKNSYEHYSRYDQNAPLLDRSSFGETLEEYSTIVSRKENHPNVEELWYCESSLHVEAINYEQLVESKTAGRFALENDLHYQHQLTKMSNIQIIMPSGTIIDRNLNWLFTESNFMSLLHFHHDFVCDKSTKWKWRHQPKKNAVSIDVGGELAWCYHRFYYQYFHWFLDCLPRLWILKKAGYEVEHYMFGNVHETDFAVASLEALGVDVNKCLRVSEVKNFSIDEIYYPASRLLERRCVRPSLGNGIHYKGGWDPSYLCFLNDSMRSWLLRKSRKSINYGRRLFVDRSDAKHRRLVNHSEVWSILKSHGFECVNPGELSFVDQVHLFSEADIIIGVHGAGLTNLLWCDIERKPRVLEISVGGLGDPGYRYICSGLGIPFMAIDGVPVGQHVHGEAFDDIRLDTKKLKASLNWLESAASC